MKMFEIRKGEGNRWLLSGRLDAAQSEGALASLNEINESCILDFTELEYISSAGMGALLATLKRLKEAGYSLKLTNLSKHIKDVFGYAGFDRIFDIE